MIRTFVQKYIAILLASTFSLGCNGNHFAEQKNSSGPPRNGAPTALESHISFSADSAYQYIAEQLAFGPRNPNSPGHRRCREYLLTRLAQWADTVFSQTFSKEVYGEVFTFTNIIAQFQPKSKPRILLSAHWDTRPYADMDPIPENRSKPILGANDGASGTAVLLELARIFALDPPPIGIDIVLFDGEDIGKASDLANFCIGSKYFALFPPTPLPSFAINLDMVADAKARFYQEEYSLQSAPEIVAQLWNIGREIAPEHFIFQKAPPVYDDHYSLIQAGIPAVNIIDQDLIGHQDPDPKRQYWHTLEDTIDKVHKETLRKVGKVIIRFIYAQ